MGPELTTPVWWVGLAGCTLGAYAIARFLLALSDAAVAWWRSRSEDG